MNEKPIYGAQRIAQEMGVSERTIWYWCKLPGGDFMQVESVDNTGGGLGRALWTFPSSIQHFKRVMDERTREKRREAANARWGMTDLSGGSGHRGATLEARVMKSADGPNG